MAKVSLALAVALGMLVSVVPAESTLAQETNPATCIFINEVHYDDASTDAGEAIEVAGPAGTDLSGWSIVLYNGNNGAVYDTDALSGVIADQAGGHGFAVVDYPVNGIQNGSPDGIALVDASGQVVQFLSYEGSLTAVDGPAVGMTSTDIGVSESGSELDGMSLQLAGAEGNSYEDFSWTAPAASTFGAINNGQTFVPGCDAPEPPPPPPAVAPGLKINELDYDQPSTDTAEFVEIYNSADLAIDLSGFGLLFVNGNNGETYESFDFPADTSLDAGDFLVVCANSATTPNCDFDVSPDTNLIQNGAPDAVAIVDPAGDVVDALSYEGNTDGYTEGAGAGADASGTPFVGLSRVPDGTDTNNNASDFDLVCVTPGEPNTDAATDCPNPTPPVPFEIYEVQGSGSSSPLLGQNVTIDGIVVGDFQGNDFAGDQLGGFHLQEANGDGDAATSDGIFVFAPGARDVAVGEYVEVSGTVAEFFGLTEITDVTEISPPGAVPPPDEEGSITPTSVTLSDGPNWEPYEGMLVTFDQDLYISEFFNYDRFGEIVLTSSRQFQPTQVAEPGSAEAATIANANRLSRITLDDGRTSQNPDPAIHPDGAEFTRNHTFRGGDILRDLTGVMDFAFDIYRMQPTEWAEHVADNPRPETPAEVSGQVKVATFNVLNFFTHLDNSATGQICGPPANLECRGANTAEELERQLKKLVAGIIALDADIVGIQEIENDINPVEIDDNRAHDAVLTLVERLNEADDESTWAWVGPANHYNDYPVRNDIIYRTGSVVPVGDPVALAHEAFDGRGDDDIDPVGRPPLAQTFRPDVDRGSRQAFTVVVNHFKSKGSSCDDFIPPGFDVNDPDTGDGQGNCNLTRVAQANALLDFIDELEEDTSGVLAVGDFNSYAMEDPMETLESGGLTDLVGASFGNQAYSYLFDGQLGTLDYILSTRSMLNWVTEVTIFHINADEPDILDYDMTFKQEAQDDLYEPIPYRVSDHDPVIVGLEFGGPGGGGRGGPPPGRGPR